MITLASFKCGSRLYGTHSETSDYDSRDVFLYSPNDFTSLDFPKDVITQTHVCDNCKHDTVKESLHAFLGRFKYGVNFSPVHIEMLFTPCHDYTESDVFYFSRWLQRMGNQCIGKKEVVTAFLKPSHPKAVDNHRDVPKHLSHIYRWLIQGQQIVDGEIIFPIKEAMILKAIKDGEIPFNVVKADILDRRARLEDALERKCTPIDEREWSQLLLEPLDYYYGVKHAIQK